MFKQEKLKLQYKNPNKGACIKYLIRLSIKYIMGG